MTLGPCSSVQNDGMLEQRARAHLQPDGQASCRVGATRGERCGVLGPGGAHALDQCAGVRALPILRLQRDLHCLGCILQHARCTACMQNLRTALPKQQPPPQGTSMHRQDCAAVPEVASRPPENVPQASQWPHS